MDPLYLELQAFWIRLLIILLVVVGLMIAILVQGAKRNRLLRSIDQSLKALPAVQNQRRSA